MMIKSDVLCWITIREKRVNKDDENGKLDVTPFTHLEVKDLVGGFSSALSALVSNHWSLIYSLLIYSGVVLNLGITLSLRRMIWQRSLDNVLAHVKCMCGLQTLAALATAICLIVDCFLHVRLLLQLHISHKLTS